MASGSNSAINKVFYVCDIRPSKLNELFMLSLRSLLRRYIKQPPTHSISDLRYVFDQRNLAVIVSSPINSSMVGTHSIHQRVSVTLDSYTNIFIQRRLERHCNGINRVLAHYLRGYVLNISFRLKGSRAYHPLVCTAAREYL